MERDFGSGLCEEKEFDIIMARTKVQFGREISKKKRGNIVYEKGNEKGKKRTNVSGNDSRCIS